MSVIAKNPYLGLRNKLNVMMEFWRLFIFIKECNLESSRKYNSKKIHQQDSGIKLNSITGFWRD